MKKKQTKLWYFEYLNANVITENKKSWRTVIPTFLKKINNGDFL